MKTTALLCDYATVSADGKLYISGANITRLFTNKADPPVIVNFALAVVIEIPWTETNRMHEFRAELLYEGADHGAEMVPLAGHEGGAIVAQFNAGRGPDLVHGEATLMPIAIPFFGLPLPQPGGYSFKLSVDGEEVAHLPFQARVVTGLGLVA